MIAAVFCAVSVFNVSSHILWRDEIRIWQFATAASTFAEMHTFMRFEGTPCLWYGALWLVSRVTSNPLGMQLFHVLIATCTVFLFTWRAPFSRTVKLLFPLGYFPLFEYAVISRNYGIALLLVLCAAAIIGSPRRSPVALGCVFFLLTQASIWGVGIAGVLFLSAVLEWMVFQSREQRMSWPSVIALGGVIVIGGALCYLSSRPGPGPTLVGFWRDDFSFGTRLANTIGCVWKAWVPLPMPKRAYWNSNILDHLLVVRCTASCVLIATSIFLFLRRPAALVPLVVGSAGLLHFTLFHFLGSVRHDGLIFVLLLAAFWIGATATRISIPWPRVARLTTTLEAYGGPLLVLLLAVQAVAGIGSAVADHFLPFSAGKEVGEFVRRELPADAVLVGYEDYTAMTLGYYAGRPIYSVQVKSQGPFFTQDERLRIIGGAELLVDGVDRLLKEKNRHIVVFLCPHREKELNEWLEENPDSNVSWELIRRFDDSTVPDECSAVYRVRRREVEVEATVRAPNGDRAS